VPIRFLSFKDGTSSVTFLPYIVQMFKKEYVLPNYIGESLSAMLPGLMGIGQGLGQDPGCTEIISTTNDSIASQPMVINVTLGNTTRYFVRNSLKPNFSVTIYFGIMFLLLLASVLAFTFLHYLPVSRRSRRLSMIMASTGPSATTAVAYSSLKSDIDRISYTSLSSLMDEQRVDPTLQTIGGPTLNMQTAPSRRQQVVLLSVNFVIAFLLFGLLPGLQSYATLPYGNHVYHLAINLCKGRISLSLSPSFRIGFNFLLLVEANLLLPISIVVSIISFRLTTAQIVAEFSVGLVASSYVILTASASPCPPMLAGHVGAMLIVTCSVLISFIFTRVRLCIASNLEACGPSLIYVYGVVTIAGQVAGGFLAYLVIDVYRALKDLPLCTSAQDFCSD
jgi:riboflavin transporter 2